jgi:arabinogalactan oligomer / maltooligosaccharide transport system permease protein
MKGTFSFALTALSPAEVLAVTVAQSVPSPVRHSARHSGGLPLMLGLLLSATLLSGAAAWGLARLTPQGPPSLLLVYFAAVLAALLWGLGRRFSGLVNWLYLMPSLVFLLAFTVFPIVLTVNFAFTNYSSLNSGSPDSARRMPVAAVGADRLELRLERFAILQTSLASSLECRVPSCAGELVALLSDAGGEPLRRTIASSTGRSVRFTEAVPAAFVVQDVTRINAVSYVALANFQAIIGKAGVQLLPVLTWNLVFAFSTVIINLFGGLVLGLLLSNKDIKGRTIYRTLLILPWAVPTVISVQMWAALLNQNFGIVNRVLGLLGSYPLPWLSDPLWAKFAIIVINLWLGFPFMMTATLSALATISDDLYEAAEIDGANRMQQVRFITLPNLRTALTPVLLSGFAFNFNNFGIIYLLFTGITPPPLDPPTATASSASLLISWGYETAFGASGGAQYGLASAVAIVIAVLTIGLSVFNFRVAGIFGEARR